jgi:hypothetical protein
VPLEDALTLSLRIDESVREACTPEVLTVSALTYEEFTVVRPGEARLVEDLWLARRTFSTLAFLMARTAGANTEASDFTEAAGTLLRRLLELLAQVVWLTDMEPPDGLVLPTPVGNHESLVTIAQAHGWDESVVYAIGLAGAIDWIDLQALRSELYEVKRQQTLGQTLVSIGGQDLLHVLGAQEAMIMARLDEASAPTTPRYDTTSLLTVLGPHEVLAYRLESDGAHGGRLGRLFQRGGEGQPMLGAFAPEWRRMFVIEMANVVMIEIARRSLQTLGAATDDLAVLAEEHIASLENGD